MQDILTLFKQHRPEISCTRVNCRTQPILCNAWMATPPYVMHISQEFHAPLVAPLTTWRRLPLDTSNATTSTLEDVYVSRSWQDAKVWDGFLDPHLGALGKRGGGHAWGIFKVYFDLVPSLVWWGVAFLMYRRFM